MHKFKQIFALVLCTLILFVNGCDSKQETESKFTQKTENNVYVNKYFKFNITLPEGWYAQDYASARKLTQEGGKMIAGDNKQMKEMMKASEERTINLFGFFEHPVGAPVPFNPNFVGVAENISFVPGIKRGKDYLYHTKQLIKQTGLNYTFDDNITVKKIDGVEFDVMDASIHINGVTVRQKYYTVVYKDYAIGFIESFGSDEGHAKLSKIIDSIRFDW